MQEQPIQLDSNISANLTREDRAYIEKIDARILGLLGGKHVRDVKNTKTLELIWDLVKARGEFLRSDSNSREYISMVEEKTELFKDIYRDILIPLPGGTVGHRNAAGRAFPFPTAERISAVIREYSEDVERLENEGFELSIVPVGMENAAWEGNTLEKLVLVYENALKAAHATGGLTDFDGNIVEMALDNQVIVKDSILAMDKGGHRIFFPRRFEKKDLIGNVIEPGEGGMFGSELCSQSRFPGYIVSLVEKNEVLPRKKSWKKVGNRKPFESGKKVHEYMKLMERENSGHNKLKMTQYRFLSIEEWLAKAIVVARQGRVLDNWKDGKSSACWCLGSSNEDLCVADAAYWHQDQRRAYLNRIDLKEKVEAAGVRVAVSLDLPRGVFGEAG